MCEPADLASWGEVLLVMVYPKNVSLAYRNALVKEKAVINDQRGVNVGWTDKIQEIDGNFDNQKCVGVLRFATPQNARRFLIGDHLIRQPDFLGGVEIMMVPLKKGDMSQKGYPIMQIIDQNINFRDMYEQQYLPMMEDAVSRYGGVGCVVCHNEPWKWRGVRNPGSVIINQWPSWEAYNSFVCSDTGKQLATMCNQIGNGFCITAELHCDM